VAQCWSGRQIIPGGIAEAGNEKQAAREDQPVSSGGFRLGINRSGFWLLGVFFLILVLIGYVWWPLLQAYLDTYNPAYPLWMQIDWLLIGIFLFMSFLLLIQADLRRDVPVFLIGLAGGLVIESWGTQTALWTYYTFERPPLWIIPAWPIASLSIDRLYRALRQLAGRIRPERYRLLYWLLFSRFLVLMIIFIWPTLSLSMSQAALLLCVFLVLTRADEQAAVLMFAAGASLGYFLELWGTTRLCWTYYTQQTPPLFAVLAHGMAAVAFWRVYDLYLKFLPRVRQVFRKEERVLVQE